MTDRKLFVIEPQEPRSASRQINRADPAEALRSSPDAPVYGGSPSRCCLAPMPLVCETASTTSMSEPLLPQLSSLHRQTGGSGTSASAVLAIALRDKQSREVPSSSTVQLPLSDTTGHLGLAGGDIGR